MDNYLRKIQMALTVTESNVAEFQRLCFHAHTDTETVILKTEKLAVAHHPIRRRTGEALGMRCAPSRTERSKIKVVNGGRAWKPESVFVFSLNSLRFKELALSFSPHGTSMRVSVVSKRLTHL